MPNDKDTKDTLEEIQKALKAATTGKWQQIPGEWYDAVFSWDGSLQTVVSSKSLTADAHLIANAPEWLRYLLSLHKQQEEEIEKWQCDNERLREEIGVTLQRWDESDKALQQSREENVRLTSEQDYAKRQAIKWNDEAVRLKGLYERERDIAEQAQREIERLRGASEETWQIDEERGVITNGTTEHFIVPDELDITPEEFFDIRMPSWVKKLVAERDDYRKALEEISDGGSTGEDARDMRRAADSAISRYERGESQNERN